MKYTLIEKPEEGRHPMVANLPTVTELGLDPYSAVSRARDYLRDLPDNGRWLFKGVSALMIRFDTRVKTYATSEKGVCIIGPQHMMRQTIPEIASELAHERLHLFRRDHLRFRSFTDNEAWQTFNMASDIGINQDLREIKGLFLNSTWLFPETYNQPLDMMTEQRYDDLRNRKQPPPKNGGNGRGNCGSCAGGSSDEIQQLLDQAAKEMNLTGQEMKGANEVMAEAIREAAAKGTGTVPGGLVRMAEDFFKRAPISWKELLPGTMRNLLGRRPGLRFRKWDTYNPWQAVVGNGAVLPTYYAPIPKMMIVIDTSGSMSPQDLGFALGVIESACTEIRGRVSVMSCDTETGEVHDVDDWRKVRLEGGGGTDFRPAFERAEETKPDVMVFVTDGYGPAPETAPEGVTVIWCITEGGRVPADFGEVVRLEDV